jgi:hypothetical protein
MTVALAYAHVHHQQLLVLSRATIASSRDDRTLSLKVAAFNLCLNTLADRTISQHKSVDFWEHGIHHAVWRQNFILDRILFYFITGKGMSCCVKMNRFVTATIS